MFLIGKPLPWIEIEKRWKREEKEQERNQRSCLKTRPDRSSVAFLVPGFRKEKTGTIRTDLEATELTGF